MHPVLISVGPITLYTYGLFVAAGILTASLFLIRHAPAIGVSPDRMTDIIFITVISGFIGARLLYIFYQFDYFLENPLEIVAVWHGGIILYGGLIGGLIGFLIMTRRLKAPFFQVLDLFTPAVALAQGFGRIGCFFNGCCYGKPTSCPLGVRFPFSTALIHPTQLYESVYCFLLFLFLIFIYGKAKQKTGITSLLYFLLYSAWRFLIEFLRNDMPRAALGLTLGQWVSLPIFLISSLMILKRFRPSSHVH